MEISFRIPARYNALHSYKATDDKIIEKIDSVFEHLEFEYSYKELGDDIVRGKIGDSRWRSIGYTLVFLPFFLYLFVFILFFPDYGRSPIAMTIYGVLFVCGILAFLLSLYKEEWIWFYNKRNEVAFTIKITPHNKDETERFIQHIRGKIKEQQ